MDIYEIALDAMIGTGPALTLDQLDELFMRMDRDLSDGLMAVIGEYLNNLSDVFEN